MSGNETLLNPEDEQTSLQNIENSQSNIGEDKTEKDAADSLALMKGKISDAFAEPEKEESLDESSSEESNKDSDDDESSSQESDKGSDNDKSSSEDSNGDPNNSFNEDNETKRKYPHHCQICDKKFLLNFQLKSHMTSDHGVEPVNLFFFFAQILTQKYCLYILA